MATSNFKTQYGFPMWVVDDDNFADEDDWTMWADDVQVDIDALNETLKFHKVSLESGYYSGCQLYVEDIYEIGRYGQIDEYDAKYNFDMTPEQAMETYNAEVAALPEQLEAIGTNYSMFKIKEVGRFSNGETLYEKDE